MRAPLTHKNSNTNTDTTISTVNTVYDILPLISIIIITLNEETCIANLLNDLVQQTHQNFEVIVVDSNSDDNTCDIVAGFNESLPSLTLERMQTRGVCLGRNTGAQIARHERLLFLDADVRLPTDFLTQACRHLHDKQLDVAGVYLSATGLPKRFALGYKLFNVAICATQFVFPTAIGACLFSTKSLHDTINGFDESVTLCEDCDYVNRASELTRFRMLPIAFSFDPRRLQQDGTIRTGWKYLYANTHRLFVGEIRNHKIQYDFGHYQSAAKKKQTIEPNLNSYDDPLIR